MTYFIGLMSGTSMDAIDVALIKTDNNTPQLISFIEHALPDELIKKLKAITGNCRIEEFARLDIELGRLFATAVHKILEKNNLSPDAIQAIGSHGQTVYHEPDANFPNSLQIGDPNTIACLTGITTVADFRRKDMALGGQGAPLAPVYHAKQFSLDESTVVLNIGGFANLTICDLKNQIHGFDTGPGNVLLDDWNRLHNDTAFDQDSVWAANGNVDQALLKKLLCDEYFSLSPPKSTGRDKFNLDWLKQRISSDMSAVDIQATLLALTVASIANAIEQYSRNAQRLVVCGGGALNPLLMEKLSQRLTSIEVMSSEKLGINPSAVEACCFAWLAHLTLEGKTGNLPSVTNASKPTILGAIYQA